MRLRTGAAKLGDPDSTIYIMALFSKRCTWRTLLVTFVAKSFKKDPALVMCSGKCMNASIAVRLAHDRDEDWRVLVEGRDALILPGGRHAKNRRRRRTMKSMTIRNIGIGRHHRASQLLQDLVQEIIRRDLGDVPHQVVSLPEPG